ncbi:helix-turn-helix transcriptional regulator [Pedobacter sp. MR22-3]|uniref:helix-turn-helix transcriptional regulator n=1 Tax=Pedobacter sp. MR22-3 TaxID=2994552 RepID=UPI002247B6DD|nr:AraC family transcriptional regulator [Pedobacter sp. MR22-3]MCX2584317.1 AraC family transcriptional regulator [Pedobacter sp. MR22-3]
MDILERIKNIPKRIMYELSGEEFKNLINRKFTADMMTADSADSLPNVFSCYSKSLRTSEFDLLKFSGSFQKGTRVNNFQDTTHVSMHFQLSGKSGAFISGIKDDQTMRQGQFNILNCIDPTSSFLFPEQQHYEYICVGLKTSFFNKVLEECGAAYQELLTQSQDMRSFALFKSPYSTNHSQISVLRLLQRPPVADNLKESYIKSKVKELLFLSLSAYSTNTTYNTWQVFNQIDIDKLKAVKDFLSINYLSALTLEGISSKFLLNEFKLKKGFKDLFGLTVFGYIHELRMQHAYTLIISGGLTVGEIAAAIGYTSDSSFIRAFKLFYGQSPGKKMLS